MVSYGTMEGEIPISSKSVSSKNRSILRPQQGGVLKTLTSKRRPISSSMKSKSLVYTMLSPRSTALSSLIFKWFITLVILADLIAFIASTDEDIYEGNTEIFRVWEAVDSWIFGIEYLLRLITVTESKKYGAMGPIRGRLRFMITSSALIDLCATLPYFLEQIFAGLDLPTLTYLRAFRLLRILKTTGFNEAMKSLCRVFRYNSEILFVAVWIGVGLILCTAVLMYYLRPRDEINPQFKSLSATIYLSTLMLTGQGGPDGSLPWYTSAVVLLTGIFSIGMFAIPASMLTWGFEGEAERLAKLRWKNVIGKESQSPSERTENNDDINDNWSYSSDDYSTDEEYLNTIAGFDDSDDLDEKEKITKSFQLADVDHSGNISLSEFLKLKREELNESLQDGSPLAKQVQNLQKKVEENSKKLDRICDILEGRKTSQGIH